MTVSGQLARQVTLTSPAAVGRRSGMSGARGGGEPPVETSPAAVGRRSDMSGGRGGGEPPVLIELLYWKSCPSHERALGELREALDELGVGQPIEVRHVDTDEQARRERFVGSPTIRIDGKDLFPPPPGEQFALTCRVYRHGDGRISPLPDPRELRTAIAQAVGR